MRWMTTSAVLLLAACMQAAPAERAPAGGGSPAPPASGPAVAAGSDAALVQEMARLVNAHRQARGCPALTWLPIAGDAAQAHSADMARRGYFDHESPEGRQPYERLAERGLSYRMVAENIAFTPQRTAEQTLQGWIASSGHRRNLENCAYTHHGIGVRNAYWTHVFVTPLTEL